MDCHFTRPKNWSDFPNLHAPLAFAPMHLLDLRPDGLTLILPPAHAGLRSEGGPASGAATCNARPGR